MCSCRGFRTVEANNKKELTVYNNFVTLLCFKQFF